jgi:hypothetical protein
MTECAGPPGILICVLAAGWLAGGIAWFRHLSNERKILAKTPPRLRWGTSMLAYALPFGCFAVAGILGLAALSNFKACAW